MKNKKVLIIIGIIAAVLIVFAIVAKQKGWIGEKEKVKVLVEKPLKRTIIETVSANGKVQPEVEVKISADVSGEIVELYIKEGDKVSKGQLLLKINPDLYVTTVERLEASVNTALANLANAKSRAAQSKSQFTNSEASYKRNKALFDQKVISQQEYDAAIAAYEVAKQEVEAGQQNVLAAEYSGKSADAALNEARKNLSRTTIYSPVDGTISKLNNEKGERVVGTSQMPGTEIMRIANLNEMEVNVEVNENDIVRAHLNDTANIEVDAYRDRKFKGIVTSIANSANTLGMSADQVTNFTVKIRILQDSYKDLLNPAQPNLSPFRPGMSATVDIMTKTVENVLSVPIQAVTTREDSLITADEKEKKRKESGDEEQANEAPAKPVVKDNLLKPQECIFVFDNGMARLTKVKTGVQDNNYIQIVEGLADNKEIITGPYSAVSKVLKDSSKVIKTAPEDLYDKKKGK